MKDWLFGFLDGAEIEGVQIEVIRATDDGTVLINKPLVEALNLVETANEELCEGCGRLTKLFYPSARPPDGTPIPLRCLTCWQKEQ